VSIGERIAERLEALGGRGEGYSQASLARAVGITQPTINALIRNPEAKSKHLHAIARVLKTSVPYLLGETDDPRGDQDHETALPRMSTKFVVDSLGLTMIPETDNVFALGGGSVTDEHTHDRRVPFRRSWLSRAVRGGEADVFLTRGHGDSMMPTIMDDDDVLVNRAEREVRQQDRIWALGYGDLGMIKRVRRLPSGVFQLISDNPAVSPIEATHEEMQIVGRVVWIGRRI
jgi:phage repressor protein C with HTH and peptisase S24 domain